MEASQDYLEPGLPPSDSPDSVNSQFGSLREIMRRSVSSSQGTCGKVGHSVGIAQVGSALPYARHGASHIALFLYA